MKVLILGGSGMLGHKLWQTLAPRFDTTATFRRVPPAASEIFDQSRVVECVAADQFDTVTNALAQVRPEVVVNCVGIVKQDAGAKDPVTSITVNSLFPHRLAQACAAANARLIHISTDCVFSGRRGNYSEENVTDAEDLYGRTKALGEIDYGNNLTIRTSMIGRELQGSHGLIEWFLSQQGKTVRGFKRAVFSGFTTNALAKIIGEIIDDHPQLNGTWHVAAEPINKFNLLSQVREAYGLKIEIDADESFVCDRSLNGEKFRRETGITAPSWPEMIAEMQADATPYDELRRVNA